MLPSFFIANTGVETYERALTVVGNNIANVNTPGFKSSRVQFADMLADSRLDGMYGTGRGVMIADVVEEFTQGSFENSNTATDLAISGNGFFIVHNGIGGNYYTRAGQFRFDEEGWLRDTNDYTVQGYAVDKATGDSRGVIGDIQITRAESEPKITEEIKPGINLDANSEITGFNIVEGYNDCIIFSDDGDAGTPPADSATALLTPGNYTGEELAAEIATQLTANSENNQIYSATYDADKGLFTITNTNNPSNTNPLRIFWTRTASNANGRAHKLAELLGFTADDDPIAVGSSAGSDRMAGRFDPDDTSNTSNFATSVVIYDSLGTGHVVEMYFRKSFHDDSNNRNQWEWFAMTQASESTRNIEITSDNQNLTVGITNQGGAGAATPSWANADIISNLSLTQGTWTPEQLATDLQTQIRAQDPAYANISVSYDNATGKFTFTNASDTSGVAPGQDIFFLVDFNGDQGTTNIYNPVPVAANESNLPYNSLPYLLGFDQSDLSDDGTNIGFTAVGTGLVGGSSTNLWVDTTLTSEHPVNRVMASGIIKFTSEGVYYNDSRTFEGITTLTDLNLYANDLYPFVGQAFSDMVDFDFLNGSTLDQNITFNWGSKALISGNDGLDGTTQFDAESVVNFMEQDGYGPGSLMKVAVDRSGLVQGLYTNGQTIPLARVALANFKSPWGLARLGNNMWSETMDSGPPIVNNPSEGSAGWIQGKALELSNVDLAKEFVDLIRNQRGFQANTRVITTSADMVADLMTIVR